MEARRCEVKSLRVRLGNPPHYQMHVARHFWATRAQHGAKSINSSPRVERPCAWGGVSHLAGATIAAQTKPSPQPGGLTAREPEGVLLVLDAATSQSRQKPLGVRAAADAGAPRRHFIPIVHCGKGGKLPPRRLGRQEGFLARLGGWSGVEWQGHASLVRGCRG